MPSAPQRSCRYPRCPKLTTDGWCEDHRKEQWRDSRDSASKRGYDRLWRSWRLSYLQRFPLCEDCKAEGIVHLAEEVHHLEKVKDRPDLMRTDDNCLSLCKSHHSARTIAGQ